MQVLSEGLPNGGSVHGDCAKCTLDLRHYVPGEGPGRAGIVLVGEAPGEQEMRVKRPFVGVAGKLLDRALAEAGLVREGCYITNACLCRPPNNRAPHLKEIRACRDRLFQEIRQRSPKIVVLLGGTAAKAVLGVGNIGEMRGAVLPCKELDMQVIVTYHPAAALYGGKEPGAQYVDLVRDLRRARRILNGVEVLVAPPVEYVEVADDDMFDALIERLRGVDRVAVDVENASDGRLLCVGLSWTPGRSTVVTEEILRDPDKIARLDEALSHVGLIAHNGKYDLRVMRENGFQKVGGLAFDTMLANYMLDERTGEHSLKTLAWRRLGVPRYDAEVAIYTTKGMENCPRQALYHYNACDVAYTLLLADDLGRELDADAQRVLYDTLLPASDALLEMELCGIAVDAAYLDELRKTLEADLEQKRRELCEVAGREFNPNSPAQVRHVLYHDLGLPIVVTANRVAMDTREETLRQLRGVHPIIDKVLEYRKQQKFYSTYVCPLLEYASTGDGRVHTTFKLSGTRTGRLSSASPNLQNIGRDPVARNIFVATPGYTLVEADYSQLEVRVVAYLSQDPVLLEAVQSTDIHTRTASMMFNAPPDQVTKELRSKAKAITFGLIYRMSPQSLAVELDIGLDEAAPLVKRFFEVFPGVQKWWYLIEREMMRERRLVTPFGRVRRFEQLPILRNHEKKDLFRAGTNFPVQSTASDLCLLALIRLDRRIRRGELGDTRLLLTVHDSIILETRENPIEIAYEVRQEMLRPVLPGLPLDVEVKVGERWGSLQELKLV
ncbi:MAG: DNA polymerase [Armatimonadota bacterium]